MSAHVEDPTLFVASNGCTVQHIETRGYRDYYRVSAGPKGGTEVTVRVGAEGVFACMTDVGAVAPKKAHPQERTCVHAQAAQEFAELRALEVPG